ncbi:MAG TPA: acyl-homoserine-lactone synthase [Syntrophorhabdaceae bacterium]|nr:acyl-homoserine-lactone synthase [Syntrophorhabdaceae bacterium]
MLSIQTVIPRTKIRPAARNIFIREGDFTVKNLTNDDEKTEAYRLRHRIFAEELGWVPRSRTLMERDNYDRNAVDLGVFDGRNILVAYVRLIPPGSSFMIEKEFSSLIGPWHDIRKHNDTAELSRLCVLPDARNSSVRGNFGVHHVSMFLYKGVYLWCARNNVRYVYVVVENKIYRMFMAKGFPCRLAGEPFAMSDGCVAVAAMIDFEELVAVNTLKRPEFIKWFTRNQSNHFVAPLQQPEFYLQPGASA